MSERVVRRIVSLLLLAYPSGFRRRFGDDLTLTYLDRFRAAGKSGVLSSLWLMIRATGHAVRDGLLERFDSRRNQNRGRRGRSIWLRDLRVAIRSLLRRPSFTGIAVGTLGIGMGATIAMFSVVDSVLLSPLPYPASGELVTVGMRLPGIDRPISVAWRTALAFGERSGALEHLATIRGYQADVDPDAANPDATRLWAASVSSGFFPVMGTYPVLGRTFTSAEDASPEARVIVLSHEVWSRRWGSDSTLVGRTMVVNGESYEVIGVMPPGFLPPEGIGLTEVDVWFPALAAVADRPYDNHRRGYFRVLARLAPGQSAERATAELVSIHSALSAEFEEVQQGEPVATPLFDATTAGAGGTLWPLFGAVVLLLTIACGNVVNLFLARATTMRRELAVRIALGASRAEVIRPLAFESLLVAVAGAALGLLLARGGVGLISSLQSGDLPRLAEVSLDFRVAAFAVGLALVSGALVAVVPGLRSLSVQRDALGEATGRTTAVRSTNRIRSVLVVAQTSLALVLVVGAGLMINSFARLLAVDPGFEPEGVLVAHIHMPRRYRESQQEGLALRQALLERVRTLPGVTSATSTIGLPLDGFEGKGHMEMTIESSPSLEIEVGSLNWVGPDYFATLGTALLPGGRGFNSDDVVKDDVVIVNQSFVREFWAGREILGERIKMGPADAPTQYRTVIGVAGDVKGATLASEQGAAVYYPDDGGLAGPPLILVVKSDEPEVLAPAIRALVRELAPSAPLGRLETLSAHVARSVTSPRFYSLLVGGFAATALLLSVVGIYGTLSYMVGQRTREMGVRIALGATPGMVMRLVAGHGAAIGVVGIILGVVASAAVSGVLTGFLFQIEPLDPWTYLASAGLLALTVAAAALVPARNATRVDPVVSLRSE